jgi:hypothetical protein
MNRTTLVGCLAAFLLAAACAHAVHQPHMDRALEMLGEARVALEEASHDKGGHRVRAIEEIRLAEDEVRAGIEFDQEHH